MSKKYFFVYAGCLTPERYHARIKGYAVAKHWKWIIGENGFGNMIRDEDSSVYGLVIEIPREEKERIEMSFLCYTLKIMTVEWKEKEVLMITYPNDRAHKHGTCDDVGMRWIEAWLQKAEVVGIPKTYIDEEIKIRARMLVEFFVYPGHLTPTEIKQYGGKIMGRAVAKNWKWNIAKNGLATICPHKGSHVYGLVVRFLDKDAASLTHGKRQVGQIAAYIETKERVNMLTHRNSSSEAQSSNVSVEIRNRIEEWLHVAEDQIPKEYIKEIRARTPVDCFVYAGLFTPAEIKHYRGEIICGAFVNDWKWKIAEGGFTSIYQNKGCRVYGLVARFLRKDAETITNGKTQAGQKAAYITMDQTRGITMLTLRDSGTGTQFGDASIKVYQQVKQWLLEAQNYEIPEKYTNEIRFQSTYARESYSDCRLLSWSRDC